MLKKLKVEQFVIIDKLEMEMNQGLTIFTGETGAGKSIMLDALGFILGDPSNPDYIRQGHPEARLEATFSPPEGHPVWAFLAENNIAPVGRMTFTVRRVLRPWAITEGENGEEDEYSDQGEIFLDDKPIDVELLRLLGTFLAEIHGQFANQSMLEPSNQMHLLDLSGNFSPEIFKNVANALADVHRYKQELEDEKVFLAQNRQELPRVENLVGRFEKLGMREGFLEELQESYDRLLTARETSEAFQSILALLIAGNGVLAGLTGANRILNGNDNLDEERTADLAGYLEAALENTRGAVDEMRRLTPEYDIDTSDLNKLDEILTALKHISIETKVKFDDLYDHYLEMSAMLFRLKNGKERLAEIEGLLQKSKMAYLHYAHILHEKRVVAAKALGEAITAELPPLKLMRAEFKVDVKEEVHREWTDLGIDVVTFKARMNPGSPFSPVAETASGGELARLILGLKVVLQEVQTIPTLIFDEVDTGIGGNAAAAVGERIALLAEKTQVMVITHSPQVASRGDQHLHVSKSTDGITTTSVVNTLTMEQRIDEISRMLAGDTVTPESRAAAQSLINEARAAAEERRRRALEGPTPEELARKAAREATNAAYLEAGNSESFTPDEEDGAVEQDAEDEEEEYYETSDEESSSLAS